MAGDTYEDGFIGCDVGGVTIRRYYPWGAKRIPWSRVQSVERFELTAAQGRGRIWGTTSPRYWCNLDPARPGKRVGFVLHTGRPVRPVVTPDDPDGFEAAVRAQAGGVPVTAGRKHVL